MLYPALDDSGMSVKCNCLMGLLHFTIPLFHSQQQCCVTIKKIKYWCLVGYFFSLYEQYIVISSDEKGWDRASGTTGWNIKWKIKWLGLSMMLVCTLRYVHVKCNVLNMWKIKISGNPLVPEMLDIATFSEHCLWRRYKCYRLKAHLHLWCAYNYIWIQVP